MLKAGLGWGHWQVCASPVLHETGYEVNFAWSRSVQLWWAKPCSSWWSFEVAPVSVFPDLRKADVLSELGADWLVGIIHRHENPEFGTLASALLNISFILCQALLEHFGISFWGNMWSLSREAELLLTGMDGALFQNGRRLLLQSLGLKLAGLPNKRGAEQDCQRPWRSYIWVSGSQPQGHGWSDLQKKLLAWNHTLSTWPRTQRGWRRGARGAGRAEGLLWPFSLH